MDKKSKMLKVHLTHEENKRIISFQKGGEVKEFRHLFLQVFSDVLLDQVAPANVKLQRYDDSFQEYVDLSNEERLEEDLKLLALVSNQERQKGKPQAHKEAMTSDHPHPSPKPSTHWVFPWIPVHHASAICFPAMHLFPAKGDPYCRPHEVKANTNYRMWSLASREIDSLVQRDSTNNSVNCKGAFSDTTGNTEVTTSDYSRGFQYISLLFKDLNSNKQYVITAHTDKSGNINIEAVQTPSGSTYPDEAQFEPLYYWSYTIFRNRFYNQKYLSSDSTGKMTLVDMAELDYPNPQALFILNKV
ncbi:uncharacterized protein [Porites lutea]|uniref:uncharacterized protein n=1 Tax=Porites lutea TaxID=51062 RepID=UPI003CC645C6